MICTKSNHSCKKSERTLRFVTNPRISDSPRRANSPLCGERSCRTPRPHRGVRPPFLNWKFQSAEREGFEPSRPCGLPLFESGTFDHSDTSPVRKQYHFLPFGSKNRTIFGHFTWKLRACPAKLQRSNGPIV